MVREQVISVDLAIVTQNRKFDTTTHETCGATFVP